MFTITKRFEFSASHQLTHLPPDHQCARLHGHNYTVEVELRSDTLDSRGFVRDYGDLSWIKRWIDERLDHRHLNDVMGAPENTTAENLARQIFEWWRPEYPGLSAVRVSETPKTCAEYRVAV